MEEEACKPGDCTAAPEVPVTPVPPPAPTEELVEFDQFMKIKLRVGVVEAAEPVPKSKKLLRLQVNLGPQLGVRQLVAGIAQYYAPETLIGRKIVVVANLKPAKLMGVESQGMLLAASSDDGSQLCLVDPGAALPAGSTVR
jgi:methionyl-tRNA synthetase